MTALPTDAADSRGCKIEYFSQLAYVCSFVCMTSLTSRHNLKLVSAILYQIFISHQMIVPQKLKKFFYFIEKALFVLEIFTFLYFSLPFHTFQIQKDKWKWNNL